MEALAKGAQCYGQKPWDSLQSVSANSSPYHLWQHHHPVVTSVFEGFLKPNGTAATKGNHNPVPYAGDQRFPLLQPGAAQAMIEVVQFKSLYPIQHSEWRIQIWHSGVKSSVQVMAAGIVIGPKLELTAAEHAGQ